MTESELLDLAWTYPLFEALYGRRSRRFGLGFEMVTVSRGARQSARLFET